MIGSGHGAPRFINMSSPTAQPPERPQPVDLDAAMQAHRAGDFEQAVAMYQGLVQATPAWPDAWNLMGLALLSLGRHPEALQAANQAIALNRHPKFLSDRAAVFTAMVQPQLALSDAQAAIKLDANQVDACVNAMGAMRALGQQAKAVRLGREYLKLHPQRADLWNNLGACLLDQQRQDDAAEAFAKACALDDQQVSSHENVARLAWFKGRTEQALLHSHKAFDLGSSDPEVLAPWAAHLQAQAIDAAQVRQVTQRDQQVCDIWFRMLDQATDVALLKLLDSPDNRNQLFAAASGSQRMGRKPQSLRMLLRAAALLPDDTDICNNLGVAHFASEDYRAALHAFQHCLALRDGFAMAWRNVGVCHFMLIEPEESREAFQKAFELEPDSLSTRLYLFGQTLQCCEWSRYEELKKLAVDAGVSDQPADDLTASLAYLAGVEKAQDMRVIARRVGASLFSKGNPALALDRLPFKRRERLRIGYFSYDFRTHPVGYLTEEIYALHDRSRFEIVALSYGPDDGSEFRKAVERQADQFIELRHLTMAEQVARIRELDIDILVDLTGNTQGTRSEVVMHRVAPIQCHWLGYVWSMGHDSYDYIIGDPFSIPPALEHGYTEKVARLPHTLQVASRKLAPAARTLTRADQGLPEDAFVICNFGSFSKLQPHLFVAWMRILHALPNAVLWMARTHRTPVQAFDRLRAIAREQGVRDEQIIFSEPLSREEHLLRYKLADLALDTYPQGSGTTAIEALWMGCPMVSMAGAGETLAIRMAGGILNAVGLPHLVTDNLTDYENLVVALGREPDQVKALRQHLETQRLSLPLFDTPRQVGYLEQCFEQMAATAETQPGPASFTVAAG